MNNIREGEKTTTKKATQAAIQPINGEDGSIRSIYWKSIKQYIPAHLDFTLSPRHTDVNGTTNDFLCNTPRSYIYIDIN